MSEYLQIQRQIAELQKKAEAIRRTERLQAIEQVKSLIQSFELSANEVGFSRDTKKLASRAPHKTAGLKLSAKFSGGKGNLWTGRGVRPIWLRHALEQGASLESFRIAGGPQIF